MSKYAHERNWISAVVSVLAAGNVGVATAAIQYGLSSVTATTPRVAVRAVNQARESVQQAVDRDYNHHSLDVEIEVTTRRTDATQDHSAIVGMVRRLMSFEARTLVSPVVTYYQLLEAWPVGGSRSVDADQREDSTTLNYRLTYAFQ